MEPVSYCSPSSVIVLWSPITLGPTTSSGRLLDSNQLVKALNRNPLYCKCMMGKKWLFVDVLNIGQGTKHVFSLKVAGDQSNAEQIFIGSRRPSIILSLKSVLRKVPLHTP